MTALAYIGSALGLGLQGYDTYLAWDASHQAQKAEQRAATVRVVIIGLAIVAAGYMIARAK